VALSVLCAAQQEREHAAWTLAGSQSNRGLFESFVTAWADAGVDLVELIGCVQRERDQISHGMTRMQQLGPVTGFVIPTLQRCGLLSERVARHYHALVKDAQGTELVGGSVEEFMRLIPGLPADTAAWVLSDN
jgi:hypothetical protein